MTANDDTGFTLVEVLIVIVILGVLAMVVVAAVGGIVSGGQESSCRAERRTLATAIEAYYAQAPNVIVPPTAPLDGDEYERTLVEWGIIRSVSKYHHVDGSGVITPAADSPC